MGRVIKFRAWDERAEVMHEDFRFIKSGNEGNDWIVFTSNRQTLQEENPHPLSNPYFQDQFKVMQYTGLKDANGVEIYESDVVYVAGRGNCKVEISSTYGVIFIDSNGFENPYIDCVAELDYPTVIGNVFQNPELLNA